MQDNYERRACDLAVYIIENRATIRAAASHFGISKSTVHTEVDLSVEFLWSTSSFGAHDIGSKDRVYALSLFYCGVASIRMSVHPFSQQMPYFLR